MDQQDIKRNDDDLLEMKMSVRKLSESLKNYSFSEETYDVEKIGECIKDQLEPPSESEISAKMAEIEKFERILKMKSEEIKTVRLKRMHETEEFTQQVKQLSTAKLSNAVKNNSEQFIKLLESEISEDTGETVNDKYTKPTRKVKVEDPARRGGTFIERNVQLAKCGDGVLSLTDEEKLRLKIVLKDSENPEVKPADNEYILSDHLKSVLHEIDRKLEEHEKTKFPIYSIRNSGMKYEAQEEPEKKKSKAKIQTTGSTERKRLRELDKLLNVFNSVTMEEISPLMDEDLQYLIEESKQYLSVSASTESLDQVLLLDPIGMPTKETMLTLVADARSKMPNFRFRYHP